MYIVYVLLSLRNNKSYVGVTSKLPIKRLHEHNIGKVDWTRNNRPFKLIYYESYYCKKDALHREKFLKTGQGRRLKQLICRYY